ncbi:MAG: hypothetical protein IRY83_12495 [Chloroflexi bacterium]|nr:hypothetical protein [Chloroflexota bacterium]
MDTAPLSRKEEIWLACRPKTCCAAVVIPSGRDIWRIARALGTPPWSFLVYFPTPTPRRDAFILDTSGRRFRIALAKQPSRRTVMPPPCIFLLRTGAGSHRCGLGANRPLACQAFPARLVGEVLCLDPRGCTCRAWTLADVDIAHERALAARCQAEAEEYVAVVEAWNRRVAAGAVGPHPDFPAYCDYLMRTYDALAAGDEGGCA